MLVVTFESDYLLSFFKIVETNWTLDFVIKIVDNSVIFEPGFFDDLLLSDLEFFVIE